MTTLTVQPPATDPLNLQGGAPTVPAVPSVQPAAASTTNILQPAAPAAPKSSPAVPTTTPSVVPSVPVAAPAATTAPSTPIQALGDGKKYDANGNEVITPAADDPNAAVAAAAGKAGLSVTDYLNSLGSQTATSAATRAKIQSDLGIPAAEAAAFALPSQNTVDFYNSLYGGSGLADLKQRILDLTDKITTANQQYTDAVGKDNENPFLSEAARTGRTKVLYDTAQSTISNLVNEQNNLQGIYANGVNEINNAVTRHSNDFTTDQTTNQAKLTHLLTQAEGQETAQQNTDTEALIQRYFPGYVQSAATSKTPATVNAPNGETLQYNKDTGQWEQLTPPVGSYSPYSNPITGQTGVLDTQHGTISSGAATTPDSGAPTIVIPQNTQANGQPQLAYANNNPGNLAYVGQAGATQGAGGFAKFATPQAGYAALVAQVGLDASRGLTLGQYITKYAPPKSNNTALYIQQASTALGATADTPLNQIDPNKVAAFQATKESGTTVTAPQPAAGSNPIQVDATAAAQVQQAFQSLAATFTNADQRTYAQYTLNKYLQSGDVQGAWDYLKTQAVNSLTPTQQDAYNGASNGIASFQQALSVLAAHPELQTGPYQQLIQNAKPWLGQNADKDYTNFNQAMQYGTTLIRNGFFGARLTDTEIALSQSFLPDPKDPAATVQNKLKGSIGFFSYVNDKVLSQKLGTPPPDLSTYLNAAGYQQ